MYEEADGPSLPGQASTGLTMAVNKALPAGEVISLVEDQAAQLEKLLAIIDRGYQRLSTVLDAREKEVPTDKQAERPELRSVLGKRVQANNDAIKRAQQVLSELLERVQL